MNNKSNILLKVRQSARKKILYLPHALRQMLKPSRFITFQEVREIINNGEIIEDYPDDPRGHSCLLFGVGKGERPIHIVCSPKSDYLAIITAYLPDPKQWDKKFKVRIK